jgi:hypothetical protein
MPNPVPPPVQNETYCVIICVPGPLTKDQYTHFNNEVKALSLKYSGRVIEAKLKDAAKK